MKKKIIFIIIAVALTFVFNLTIESSYESAEMFAQTNTTNNSVLLEPLDSFNAKGLIGSVISVNTTTNMTTTTQTPLANTELEPEKPYITVGNLNLNVTRGNVTDFIIDFIMVHTDGTTFHTHRLNNFEADSVIPVLLNPDGTTVISGMVDVGLNGNIKWTNVHTVVLIEKLNAISINPSDNDTENHFKGQTIYGAITSLVDQNGNKVITTPSSDLA